MIATALQHRRTRIGRELLWRTLLTSSIITLILTAAQLYRHYDSELDEMRHSRAIIQESILPALGDTIWEYDNRLLRSQLLSMERLPYIKWVSLTRDDGEHFSSGLAQEGLTHYQLAIKREHAGKTLILGQLQIGVDLASIYYRLSMETLQILLSNAVKTLIVAFVILSLIYHRIGKPLIAIGDYLRRRQPDEPPVPLILDNVSSHQDEVSELLDAVNAEQQRGWQNYTEKQQAWADKERIAQQLMERNAALARMDRQITMGEMATSLAHELNQPLASITGYADIAKRLANQQPVNAELLNRTLGTIADEGIRASAIIKRTREFVKNRQAHKQPLAIHDWIEKTIAILQHEATKQGVNIVYHRREDNEQIKGDLIQLQQVLINLLRNAMDALRQAQIPNPQIDITVQSFERDYCIAVSDNGPGIREDILANLFSPFNTSKQDGMGVGLAISRNLVEAHGGRLEGENQQQGGAQFDIFLPKMDQSQL